MTAPFAPPDGTGDVYVAYRGPELVAALKDDDPRNARDNAAELDRWAQSGRTIRRLTLTEFRNLPTPTGDHHG